ncbi:DNA-binding transcriptional regulator AraC [Paenibacillus baekrokdamisoli]|uniref:DNA-binding transcriptional regulator AraC n=1 Tax=Paenibacillus baekrokdamisoli TaxID=1712516 RepID=A0A3G9IK57_9BACL|nr:AraC family transcriptional regulator [Paenibacillus baekrokdamisoli]MBB3067427.1 AraC family transcriptional regulator of arabinose operon [Paenibacillus baekrokdamisoli]BBH19387.1 DNA-binding transcriptional regulator AraC [Paenibacillus baekrokdamisoli]
MLHERDDKLRAEPIYVGMAHHKRRFRNPREFLNTYIIRLQTSGYCEALIDNEFVVIEPGDLLMFRPGEKYELIMKDNSIDYYVICKGTWIDQWWAHFSPPQKTTIPLDDDLLKQWNQLAKEKLRMNDTSEELTDYILRVFCLTLQRLHEIAGMGQTSSPSYIAYRIKKFIDQHATEDLKLEQIAKHAGISISRAVYLFKTNFGQSIMSYAIEVRLAAACERIRFSVMSLEYIAKSSGFNSYTYFYRQFRMHYGLSPRQYKEEQQKRLKLPMEH